MVWYIAYENNVWCIPAKVNDIPVQKEERNTHITPLQILMGLTFTVFQWTLEKLGLFLVIQYIRVSFYVVSLVL